MDLSPGETEPAQQSLSQGKRRLAAIMFTDMVGYTALTQSNEAQAMDVLDRHNRLLRPFFPKFYGREVKSIGDSFLVEFDSALEAIKCAVAMQSYLHDYNLSSKEEWKINLRIGIHLGDVIHQDGDVFGDAVNIASRIEPLARPEGVVVSEQVYDQVQNKSELPLVSLGEKSLKNVSRSLQVYALQMPWEGVGVLPRSPIRGEKTRIAVLPFTNMSSDPEEGYFADGVTEELITSLSGVKQLTVIARTSVMKYKGSPKGALEVGRELNVGSLIEGSVRKAGNRVRITAQLIDAATEGHLWAQNYDRQLEDIFAIQTEIAEKVADELRVRLVDSDRRAIEEKATSNLEAYTLYLRAMQLHHEGGKHNLGEAVNLFEAAVAKDPAFVRAYAGLAHARRAVAHYEDYATGIDKAEAAATKAIELGPETAEAHAAMATVSLARDRFELARQEMEKAIQINPNLSEVYHLLGEEHLTFGRFKEGVACARKAYGLDPLSYGAGTTLANGLRIAGMVDEAIEVLHTLKELHPNNPGVYDWLSVCYFHKKELVMAGECLDIGLRMSPKNTYLRIDRGCLWGLLGKRKEAEDELNALLAEEASPTGRLNAIFFIRTFLGDMNEAFETLNQLADLHAWYFALKFDPLFEKLRKDPRFAEFCKKVGMPP